MAALGAGEEEEQEEYVVVVVVVVVGGELEVVVPAVQEGQAGQRDIDYSAQSRTSRVHMYLG